MLEPLYYKLADAERLLGKSRDTLIRLEKAGLLVMHGKNHGKSVTGASLRALAARIEAGEDIWATLKALESASRAPSEPKPIAKARSTKTERGDGGTSPRPKTASDSLASEPIASVAPAWLKKIT